MVGVSSISLPHPQNVQAFSGDAEGTPSLVGGMESVSKDEFLKLLVAQLQNQDPMNPVKNEDFLTQLATFSSLEQLVSIRTAINDLAEELLTGNGDVPNTEE